MILFFGGFIRFINYRLLNVRFSLFFRPTYRFFFGYAIGSVLRHLLIFRGIFDVIDRCIFQCKGRSVLNGLNFDCAFDRTFSVDVFGFRSIFLRRVFFSRLVFRIFCSPEVFFISLFFHVLFVNGRRPALWRIFNGQGFANLLGRRIANVSRRLRITLQDRLLDRDFTSLILRFFFTNGGTFARSFIRRFLIRLYVLVADRLHSFGTGVTYSAASNFLVRFRREDSFYFYAFMNLVQVRCSREILLYASRFDFFDFVLCMRQRRGDLFGGSATFFQEAIFRFNCHAFRRIFFFCVLGLIMHSRVDLMDLSLFTSRFIISVRLMVEGLIVFKRFSLSFQDRHCVGAGFRIFLDVRISFFLFDFIERQFTRGIRFIFASVIMRIFEGRFISFFSRRVLTVRFLCRAR